MGKNVRQEGQYIVELRNCRNCGRPFESFTSVVPVPGAFRYGQFNCPKCANKLLAMSRKTPKDEPKKKCSYCNGTGRIMGYKCVECNGRGK